MWFFTFLLVVSGLISTCHAGNVHNHGDHDMSQHKYKHYDEPYMTGSVTDCPPNIMFLLDGSDSVSPIAFNVAKAALAREIRDVTQTFDNVHVGVIMFSQMVEKIDLMARNQQEIGQLISQVENLRQPRMKTSLPMAINHARQTLMQYSVKEGRAYNGDKAGGVIVLFSDGQTENPIATIKEAKMAKDKHILIISMSLGDAHLGLLKHISHVVQDSMNIIDWPSYVACPATTLPPVARLSNCRDFVMVVDGSDSVLRHKETVTQYMAYTALRYRMVANAIGFNVYGTDPTVQHADTRIRPEEDKYELAMKIRTELMFPKSGGTGTDTAILQSVTMLEDDLRDTSKGLVLITDGSPPDPQAARQAIQAARDRGYPVVIIRVGDHMTDAELNVLAGNDQRNVFSVPSFTDLFSVNFDDILCGGQTTVCPRPCPFNAQRIGGCSCSCNDVSQVYNSVTNQCDSPPCTLVCPINSVRDGVCGCRCTSPNQFYDVNINQCVTTCPRSCPSNAQRGNGCTCTCFDPNRQYNSFTNQCECIRNCPTEATQTFDCGCICNDPLIIYNSQTNQCGDRVILCPNNTTQAADGTCICPAGYQFNNSTRQCVCQQTCPPNAQLTNDCSCRCNDQNQFYNSGTNQCECQRICPFGSQPASGCSCTCNDQNQQYNSQTNQCECQRPCPFNAQRTSGCSCTCNGQNQRYNIQTNECECRLVCPLNAQRTTSGCSCTCNDPNQQYNSAINQCVCRQSCPSNAIRVGGCGCACNDGNQQYNSQTNLCECPRSCPSGASRVSGCGCSCNDPNLQYNSQTNQCECPRSCPSGASRVRGCGCSCNDPNLQYNSQTNQCECSRNCPSGAIQVGGCSCSCINPNQRFDTLTNRCVCRQTCPSNAFQVGVCDCSCSDSNQQYNSQTNQCECALRCPSNAFQVGGCSCSCNDPNLLYNSQTNQCECIRSCPTNASPQGTCGCSCNDPRQIYNSQTNRCECTSSCPTNASPQGTCGCSCNDPRQIYNSQANRCECIRSCPTNASPQGTCDCSCNDPRQIYNSQANRCECRLNCPFDATLNSATCDCICNNLNQQYNSQTNQCECPRRCPREATTLTNCSCQCPSPFIYSPTNNVCGGQNFPCPVGFTLDPTTQQCVQQQPNCPVNAVRQPGGFCQCNSGYILNSLGNQCVPVNCPSIAAPQPDSSCRCPDGYLFNSTTRQCDVVVFTSRERCPASEYSCENGQIAYRDCTGRCSCVCESRFAGPRCEIVVNANLCDNCQLINGHYHDGVPGFCELYVHCVPVLIEGADPRTRPAQFTPYIMSCPPGTFYIERPDGWKGCDYLDNGVCSSDQCPFLPPNASYADTSACQSYWKCSSSQRLTAKECCPAGQAFDSNFGSCVPSPSCYVTCGPLRQTGCPNQGNGVNQCPYDVNPQDPNEYFYASVPWAPMKCLPTDIMNLTLCRCVPALDSRNQNCVPTVSYDFEDAPHSLEDNVPRQDVPSFGLVGDFRGDDDLILKAFAGSGFYIDHFQIDIRVFLPQPFSGGQRMAVVTNADCEKEESASITMDGQNFYFRIFPTGSFDPAEIVIPYAGRTDANGWYDIKLVYRRISPAEFQFSGTVGGYTEFYNGFVPLTSYIDTRECALHVGYGYNYAGLVGYVDDVNVWRCDPSTATFQG